VASLRGGVAACPGAELELATLIVIVALVVGFVVVVNRPAWKDKTIVRIEGRSDSSGLAVTVAHGRCSSGDPVVERVVVRAQHNVRGDCDDIALRTTITVALDELIGERRVLIEPADELLECSISGRPNAACEP
jgi:hypothetical protein